MAAPGSQSSCARSPPQRLSAERILRSPDGGEEFDHLGLQALVFVRKQLRGRKNLGGGRAGIAGAAVDVGDRGRDLGGTNGRLLDVAGDFLGRSALLLDRGRDRRS